MRKLFLNVQGGLGLNIACSSFITEYSDEADFYVCSPYYDVYIANNKVKAAYKPNEIRDFIFDAKSEDGEIVTIRLYDLSDFIYKRLDYTQAWCKLCGLEYRGKSVKSILDPLSKYPFLTKQVNDYLTKIRDYKDFIIVQFTGGQSPLVNVPDGDWSKVQYNYDNEPLKRHYPTEKAQEFCDLYHEKHPDTAIIVYGLPNEPSPRGDYIFKTTIPYLAYYELAKNERCKGTVSIDSSLQHLVAGVVKSVVIWGHSTPNNFGYDFNKNIVQKCRRDDILYFTQLGPSGAKIDYIEPKELLEEVEAYLS